LLFGWLYRAGIPLPSLLSSTGFPYLVNIPKSPNTTSFPNIYIHPQFTYSPSSAWCIYPHSTYTYLSPIPARHCHQYNFGIFHTYSMHCASLPPRIAATPESHPPPRSRQRFGPHLLRVRGPLYSKNIRLPLSKPCPPESGTHLRRQGEVYSNSRRGWIA
jgi:hypothetical protein